MSTRLPGNNPTAYLGLKETNPPQLYFRTRAPLATDSRSYDRGDIWIDTVALEGYILGRNIGGVANWITMTTVGANESLTGDVGGAVFPDGVDNINFFGAGGLTVTGVPAANTLTVAPSGGGSLVESVTGDAGLAVGPDGVGNIDILGNSGAYLNGILFTGDPANNTLTGIDLRNITVYVVDAVAGQTEYQTVQAAVDAANADGGGTVYIRPGTYTEDLALYDAVDIIAAVATPAGYQTTIIGSHAPPATGAMSFRNLALSDTTDILASAVAGTTTIVLIDCITDIANGYTINLPNWTGLIAFLNSHCVGTQDGFADIGAGGADFLGLNSTLGVGNTNIMALGGNTRINNCNINCQMDWVGNAAGIIRASQLTRTWLVSDNAACVMTDTLFISDSSATFLNHTSTGNVTLSNVTISTDQDPNVITGTGTVIFGSVVFALNSDINVGITKQSVGNVETGPIHIGSGVTDPTNHIEVIEEVIADDVTILAVNTDNTDPASDTIVNLLTGGASAGDPFLHLEVTAVTEYSFGIDNSATDILKLTDGATPSAGNLMWAMTTAGERTMPLQPAFMAYLDTAVLNVTGNATVYTVIYDTEPIDQGADFAIGTGIFTAPVTGRYHFNLSLRWLFGAGGYSNLRHLLVTSNGVYSPYTTSTALVVGDDTGFTGSILLDMDAADTAHTTFTIEGGLLDCDIRGEVAGGGTANRHTYFSGFLAV